MKLINIHRRIQELPLALLAAVCLVLPLIALYTGDPAGILRWRTKGKGEGIRLISGYTVGSQDIILVGLPLSGVGAEGLPYSQLYGLHRLCIDIPAIPISHHTDLCGIGCPQAENEAVALLTAIPMTAHIAVSAELLAAGKAFQPIVQGICGFHYRLSPPVHSLSDTNYTTLHKNCKYERRNLITLFIFPFR
jgi:hypothetical protein